MFDKAMKIFEVSNMVAEAIAIKEAFLSYCFYPQVLPVIIKTDSLVIILEDDLGWNMRGPLEH